MNTLSPATGIANIYRGIWQYSQGMRAHFVLALILLGSSEMIKLLIPLFSGSAINALQNSGFAGGRQAALDALAAMGCLVGSWIIYAPGRILERNVALKVRSNYSNAMSVKILNASMRWHSARHSVDTAQLLTQSGTALFNFSQTQYIYLQNAISLFGPLIALLLLAPKVAFCGAVGYALLAAISVTFDRIMLRIHTEQLIVERRYFTALTDVLSNIVSVIALRKERGSLQRLAEKLEATAVVERREYVINEQKWAAIDILASALVYIEVGLYVYWSEPAPGLAGGLALGSVFMVYEYAKRIDGVITVMVSQFAQLNSFIAGYGASQTLLDIEERPAYQSDNEFPWRNLKARSISYQYPNVSEPVLKQFSCSIERGKHYALVGQSGSGKSTLLSLFAGLEQPSQGCFIADNHEILTDLKLSRIATLVPQGSHLFEGSLAENLAMGDEFADRKMLNALRVTCSDFAATTEDELAGAIEEAGKNWSGGQRQRIGVARGLLAAEDRSLLLMDEPGAGLDGPTERKLITQIFAAFPQAAIIVSIHRLDLLDLFDEVIHIGTDSPLNQSSESEKLAETEASFL